MNRFGKTLFALLKSPKPAAAAKQGSGLLDKESQTLRPAIGVTSPQREQTPAPAPPPMHDGPAWDAPWYGDGGTEHSLGRMPW